MQSKVCVDISVNVNKDVLKKMFKDDTIYILTTLINAIRIFICKSVSRINIYPTKGKTKIYLCQK